MIQATQLKKGMCIKHENELYRIVEAQHKTPGQPARDSCRRRSGACKTGSISEHRFRSVDMVERAILDETEMEYLYQDGDMYHFMNNETFEQMGLSAEVLGDAVEYLIPNIKLEIEFYEGRPVGIELPLTVEMKVMETEPGDQGRLRLERGQAGEDGDRARRAGPRLHQRGRRDPDRHRDRLLHRARQQVGGGPCPLPPGRPAGQHRGHHRQHVQREERGADPPRAPRPDRPPEGADLQAPARRPLLARTRS